jgi:hypothetical protein
MFYTRGYMDDQIVQNMRDIIKTGALNDKKVVETNNKAETDKQEVAQTLAGLKLLDESNVQIEEATDGSKAHKGIVRDKLNQSKRYKVLGSHFDSRVGKRIYRLHTGTPYVHEYLPHDRLEPVKEEAELNEAAKVAKKEPQHRSNNEGYGFHGEAYNQSFNMKGKDADHNENAHNEYDKYHAKYTKLLGTDAKTTQHYMDSKHGRHMYHFKDNDSDVKKDFDVFNKSYHPERFEESLDFGELDEARSIKWMHSDTFGGVGQNKETGKHHPFSVIKSSGWRVYHPVGHDTAEAAHEHSKKENGSRVTVKHYTDDFTHFKHKDKLAPKMESVEQIDEINHRESGTKGIVHLKKFPKKGEHMDFYDTNGDKKYGQVRSVNPRASTMHIKNHETGKVHKLDVRYSSESFDYSSLSESQLKYLVDHMEELDELYKKTLGSYIKKAKTDMAIAGHAMSSDDKIIRTKSLKRYLKRDTGINKAVDKLTKEEVELIESSLNLPHPYRRDLHQVQPVNGGVGVYRYDPASQKKEFNTPLKLGHVGTDNGAGKYTAHDENGKQISGNHPDTHSALKSIAAHHIKNGNGKKYHLE